MKDEKNLITEFEVELSEFQKDKKPLLEPEQILEKLEYCSYKFEESNRRLRILEQVMTEAEATARSNIMSRNHTKLTDEVVSRTVKSITEMAGKDKNITVDLADQLVYLECKELSEPYRYFEKAAKQAEKEYDMYARQLSWYQSKLKFGSAELFAFKQSESIIEENAKITERNRALAEQENKNRSRNAN